jgi:RNA-binding motif X-linked protein 2
MNVTREIERLGRREIDNAVAGSGASWHDDYKDSAYVFVGNLDFRLSEGDVVTVFSQYGEIADVNLVRDRDTGKSRGFCYIAYEDQRSTVLAVDNFNGMELLGRTIRVDHCRDYRHEPAPGTEAAAERERERQQRRQRDAGGNDGHHQRREPHHGSGGGARDHSPRTKRRD